MSIDIHLPASRQVDPNTFVGGESRDFRILKNGGFLSKPRISGKNFFDIPVLKPAGIQTIEFLTPS